MNSKTAKLINKALSTESEEEALSCLRLARRGFDGDFTEGKDWESLARKYYRIAKDRDEKWRSMIDKADSWMELYYRAKERADKYKAELEKSKSTVGTLMVALLGVVPIGTIIAFTILW